MGVLPVSFNTGSLATPGGTLAFVISGDGLYFYPDRCLATQEIRAPSDDIPQGHGADLYDSLRGKIILTLAGYILPLSPESTRDGIGDDFVSKCRTCTGTGTGTYSWSTGSITGLRLLEHPEVVGGQMKDFRVILHAPGA
jgi:hypothetical protein